MMILVNLDWDNFALYVTPKSYPLQRSVNTPSERAYIYIISFDICFHFKDTREQSFCCFITNYQLSADFESVYKGFVTHVCIPTYCKVVTPPTRVIRSLLGLRGSRTCYNYYLFVSYLLPCLKKLEIKLNTFHCFFIYPFWYYRLIFYNGNTNTNKNNSHDSLKKVRLRNSENVLLSFLFNLKSIKRL